jgi:Domain of unknown function (DUF4296)
MIRFTFLILTILSLISFSCTSRRSKLDRKNLIPEKDLVSILTDTYIADGILAQPKFIIKFSPLDSLSTYDSIIRKHGYTKEMMDKTIRYYYIKDPKKLISIYDKVLGILSVMQSRVEKELALKRQSTGNLWPGRDWYSFPDPSGTDSTDFNITLLNPGSYNLTATVTLFPDDETLNPGIRLYSCNPDSLQTGKRKYINSLPFIKDGFPHTYTITVNVPVRTTLFIRGSLYRFDNNPDNWDKHLIIQNISLKNTFASS